MEGRAAAERAARQSYGRLLALLSARTRDIAAAEDALSEAFRSALESWSETGAPDRPEAWLLTVARRRLVDESRRHGVRDVVAEEIIRVSDTVLGSASENPALPDERLSLLFACAHEAIDPRARTPLMLQTVIGMGAEAIAAAFLVSPRAMGQRLVRAKRKLKLAGIRFAVPDRALWPQKVASVLDAVYVAYNAGWAGSGDAGTPELAQDAVWLGSLVANQLADAPEAHGLVALMLYCEARRGARFDAAGRYVPLSEQDPALWSTELIARAEQALRRAVAHGQPGRYQIEASIQAAHAERARSGVTPWPAIVGFYDILIRVAPTVGALVSHAAAVAKLRGAACGLAALAQIPPDAVRSYQSFWAVKAHLLTEAGEPALAADAFRRAIALAEDPKVRAWLSGKAAEVRG